MAKQKTVLSEIIQKRCVLPHNKLKKKALKKGELDKYYYHGNMELCCINIRENSKK